MTDKPFPDPTISELMVDKLDLQTTADGLITAFNRKHRGARLHSELKRRFDVLVLWLEIHTKPVAHDPPLPDLTTDFWALQRDLNRLVNEFHRKYPQSTLRCVIDYISLMPQFTLHVQF